VIPHQIIVMLSGIPATRKSTFGRYLAREHSFAHYDLECYPRGWPDPGLKPAWDPDRRTFVALASDMIVLPLIGASPSLVFPGSWNCKIAACN
jgi:hypothetical protein